MKWFFKWFSAKCREVNEDVIESKMGNSVRLRGSSLDLEGGLTVQVKSAIGGKIVQFRTYDEKRDYHSTVTYLIHDNEDFGEALGKLITIESLKL